MPKYKYVDGVKYRVVPQSVLGYALVKEGSDNSLPSGGTEGQVLAKASDADYDVEWSTVEGGGGSGDSETLVVKATYENNAVNVTTPIEDLVDAYENGKNITLVLDWGGTLYGYNLMWCAISGEWVDFTFYNHNYIFNPGLVNDTLTIIEYHAATGWTMSYAIMNITTN